MIFCLVYENAQNHLLTNTECPVVAKKYIGMRSSLVNVFSLLKTERGLAQMMSLQMRKTFQDQTMTWASQAMVLMTSCQKKSRLPIFDWFENTFKGKDLNKYFPIVEILSRLMNEQYNQLKEKFPSLTIEKHQVLFQPKSEQKRFLLSTNILTLLYHFSDKKEHCHCGMRSFVGSCF